MDKLPRTIHAPRLTLRPFSLDDVEPRFTYCADEDWAEYFPIAQPYTMADAEEFIAGRMLDVWGQDPAWWAADLDGLLVGHVGLWPDPTNRQAELGYGIARGHWGQGLATEAASYVVNAVFGSTGIERVFARADVRNGASRRVLEKIGLKFAGEVRGSRVLRGNRIDEVYFAIMRSDWRILCGS